MSLYAIDCEMVGSKNKSMPARVSIVDGHGKVVLDEIVKPTAPVTDYRTSLSGITQKDLDQGSDFTTVQHKVQSLIKGSILVGHSLDNDLNVLKLSHPIDKRCDLAKEAPLLKNEQPQGLKTLAKEYLGRDIQQGPHDSVEDAKASMDIYKKIRNN